MKNTKTFLTGAKVLLFDGIGKKLTEKVQFLWKNKKK